VSARDDVVFGTLLFGRMQGGEGASRVLGLFINTLPVRIRVGDASVQDAVRETHALLARLMRHEHAPLALAQRCSAVAAPAPLFSALLNYRHTAIADVTTTEDSEAWSGIEVLGGEERTNYPLVLNVDDLGVGFALTAQVQASVDPERICAFMYSALEQLVQALETAPHTPVRCLDVLPHAEREQLLVGWNTTDVPSSSELAIHEVIQSRAEQNPLAIAVIKGQQRISYGELNAQANRLARYLRDLGIGPDARVVLCMERSADLIVGLLAILKSGAGYVPVDPNYPSERLAHMLADSAPLAVLTHAQVPAAVQAQIAIAVARGAELVPVLDLQADALRWQHKTSSDLGEVGLTPDHLAYVIYTSGSTGRPKAAQVLQRGWRNLMDWYLGELGFSSDDNVLLLTSHSFDLTQKNIVGPLMAGASLHLGDEPFEPRALLDQVQREDIRFLNLAPSAFHALIDVNDADQLRSVRSVMLGGEPIQVAKLLQLSQPRPQIINNYGPTECADVVTWHRLGPLDQLDPHSPVPLGRPIRNTRLYILDAHQRPCPIGVAGELCVAGAGVGRGYLNRAELTAERFVDDPFHGGRMYKTGDLAKYRADGNIEFLGRNDFQVKIRGFRIELGEIEAKLAEHPGIKEAVVLAREDSPGDKRLVAYYTQTDSEVSTETLRAHLAISLPEYMVPVAYVLLAQLPLNPNGKLDRRAFPAPDGHAYASRGYEAPQGEVETRLAQIWAELLAVERVGRHDNFFELGGHSLLAVSLIERMRQADMSADVRTLFATPT
ncbi:MAG: amino acid adenylation domain-containing protein, partial [Pseudomonadota bacterium]